MERRFLTTDIFDRLGGGGGFSMASALARIQPSLPPSLRYLDEYDDSLKEIQDLAGSHQWRGSVDTKKLLIDFSALSNVDEITMGKHFAVWMFGETSAITAFLRTALLVRFSAENGSTWLCCTNEVTVRVPLALDRFILRLQ